MTPAMASEPYSADAPPVSISTRSTSTIGIMPGCEETSVDDDLSQGRVVRGRDALCLLRQGRHAAAQCDSRRQQQPLSHRKYASEHVKTPFSGLRTQRMDVRATDNAW